MCMQSLNLDAETPRSIYRALYRQTPVHLDRLDLQMNVSRRLRNAFQIPYLEVQRYERKDERLQVLHQVVEHPQTLRIF